MLQHRLLLLASTLSGQEEKPCFSDKQNLESHRLRAVLAVCAKVQRSGEPHWKWGAKGVRRMAGGEDPRSSAVSEALRRAGREAQRAQRSSADGAPRSRAWQSWRGEAQRTRREAPQVRRDEDPIQDPWSLASFQHFPSLSHEKPMEIHGFLMVF